MANKNAVVEVKDGGVPAYLAGYKGPATNTMMESDDRIVPRMKLLQAISPELKSFNEAKEGVFWHSILNESLGSEVRFAVIMAGGEGQRLRPFTETTPKPMIDVGGMPLLEQGRVEEVARNARTVTSIGEIGHKKRHRISESTPSEIITKSKRLEGILNENV